MGEPTGARRRTHTSNQGTRSNRLSSEPGLIEPPLFPISKQIRLSAPGWQKSDGPFVKLCPPHFKQRMHTDKRIRLLENLVGALGVPRSTFQAENVLERYCVISVVCRGGCGGLMADDLMPGAGCVHPVHWHKQSFPTRPSLGQSSISSGIPSAASCWSKTGNFPLTRNPGLEMQFAELSLPAVRSKMTAGRSTRLPAQRLSRRVQRYVKECYPIGDDRRAFFQDKVRQAVPYIGYRLMPGQACRSGHHSVGLWPQFRWPICKGRPPNRNLSLPSRFNCQERLFRRPKRSELHGETTATIP